MKIKYLLLLPMLVLVSCRGENPTPPSSFKVTFDANGGVFADSTTTKEVSVKAGEIVMPPEDLPTHTNDYLFGNWYENKEGTGIKFDFSTPITHDTTLYAKWLNNSGVDSDWDGLADAIDPAKDDRTYTAKLLEIYPPILQAEMPIEIDYRRFVDLDNTEFNHDLEKLGNICATDIYLESTTTLKGPSTIYEPLTGDDDEELYLQLGCIDIEKHAFNPDTYSIDKFDTYTCMLAHHYFVYNNTAYEVLYITNQGTDSEAEWFSDFDVGNDNADYAHVTGVNVGEHLDWINADNKGTPIHHKGFDVATNREYKDVIEPYIENHINKDAELIIFNTGHSRGAAIGNLLGKKFNDNKDKLGIYKCFTYTYATPTTVYDSTNHNNVPCSGIFNILNGDDLVPMLPLKAWDYYRYGEDITHAASDDAAGWKQFVGAIEDYEGPDYENLTKDMEEMAPTRDDIYSPHIDDDTQFTNKSYATIEERNAAIEEWLTKADFWYGRNTIDFNSTNSYTLKGYNRPVSLMNRLSVVLGCVNEINIDRLWEMMGDGMLCKDYKIIEYEFLTNGLKLLTAHRGATYYFVSEKLITE